MAGGTGLVRGCCCCVVEDCCWFDERLLSVSGEVSARRDLVSARLQSSLSAMNSPLSHSSLSRHALLTHYDMGTEHLEQNKVLPVSQFHTHLGPAYLRATRAGRRQARHRVRSSFWS